MSYYKVYALNQNGVPLDITIGWDSDFERIYLLIEKDYDKFSEQQMLDEDDLEAELDDDVAIDALSVIYSDRRDPDLEMNHVSHVSVDYFKAKILLHVGSQVIENQIWDSIERESKGQ